ncbi:MAG: glycerate kinase [Candidatus Aminicenantes bacterium]|nr:glycerate kinase [Candidatus Aminicenantes bacterium]MDH5383269.1 glycerate kinase [Candidatus Aminicenantes bacterium]
MNRSKDLALLRKNAQEIFQAGVEAVNPINAVKKHLFLKDNQLTAGGIKYDLTKFENIYVIGAGKASAAMAQALEDFLGDRLRSGIINVKYGHTLPLKKIQVNEAGHPVPDEAGFHGTQQIVHLLERTDEKDLVLFLISGGGSALLPYPIEGLSLEDKQKVTRVLLKVGATIHEINALRKHLSQVKGGRLAQLAYPSTLVSLILSDVIGDDLDSIASGPTVPDHSTFRDCMNIMEKYGIRDKVPSSVIAIFEKGVQGEIEETPKAGDSAIERTQNLIIGSNRQAVEAAREKAFDLGYNGLILSTYIEGETKDVAKVHAAVAKEILAMGNPIKRPACVISGGETTVTVHGKGKGGRNQEFVLAAAIEIEGLKKVIVMSGGTDGTDGPTDAAGAVADGTTVMRAEEMGMDAEQYLRENDSYHFFKPLGDLIITGPTYTNVMDLRLVLVI